MLTSNNEDAHNRNAESPMDASGDVNNPVRQYLVTMSGDNLSPSPNNASSMLQNDERPALSMLDAVKSHDKSQIFSKNNSHRPSTRFEIAF